MELGIHPDAIREREELYRYGIGYNSPLEFLEIIRTAKGNQYATNMHVTCWCPSTAVELIKDFKMRTYIGAKFVCTASLAVTYRDEIPIPETLTALWASDLADRFLRDPRCTVAEERRIEVMISHALARNFAQEAGELPPPVVERLRADMQRKMDFIKQNSH